MKPKEIQQLIQFLKSTPKKNKYQNFPTYWEAAIWLFDKECGFTDDADYDEDFPEGCNPKSNLYNNPQFVPLNTRMPDYNKLIF